MLADRVILGTEQVTVLQSHHGQSHVVGSDIAALDTNILSSGDYLLLYTRQCPPLIHLKRENPLGYRKINTRRMKDLRSPGLSC